MPSAWRVSPKGPAIITAAAAASSSPRPISTSTLDDPPYHLPEEMRPFDHDEQEAALFDDVQPFEHDERRRCAGLGVVVAHVRRQQHRPRKT